MKRVIQCSQSFVLYRAFRFYDQTNFLCLLAFKLTTINIIITFFGAGSTPHCLITKHISNPYSIHFVDIMSTYTRRHITPPTAPKSQTRGSIDSGIAWDSAYYSLDSSPESLDDSLKISPIRQFGPPLLPKIRAQDQFAEPSNNFSRHKRSASASSTVACSSSLVPYPSRRLSSDGRSVSPSNQTALISPISLVSPVSSAHDFSSSTSVFEQPSHRRRQSIQVCRSRSGLATNRHARAESASSVEAVLGRYGYPTYRRMPSYRTVEAGIIPDPAITIPAAAQNRSHIDPNFSIRPNVSHLLQVPQPLMTDGCHPLQMSQTPTEFPYLQGYGGPVEPVHNALQPVSSTSCLMEYLSSSNPPLDLVQRTSAAGANKHFWWDIRNVRKWNEFNIKSISSVPGLIDLLQIPVSTDLLPAPPRPNFHPDSEAALHDIWRDVYATKVNAALGVAQGNKHMAMHAQPRGSGAPRSADFVANYQHDTERTIVGDIRRGRVVGIIKTYHSWNSGMRTDLPSKQVYYLHGLAHIHRLMREHNCRYGFIATEIELVCVRCGGSGDSKYDMAKSATAMNTGSGGIPLFGFLELSAPIRVAEEGRCENGDPKMTVGLALWYLHMLAKEDRLPGCPLSWKMDVGLPSALTRQRFIERDSWIPKPQLGEQRTAKRLRGWVWPNEPLHRREVKEFSKTRGKR